MWCRLTWHILEEAVLSQELRLVQLLGVDGNSSVILQWEVDCAFFKEWSSMCEDEDEKWVKSVFSTACVTVQQQPSSNQRRISNFSTLKGFLLSETLTETFSTSSPQTSGSPSLDDLHSLSFPITLQWLQRGWSSLVMSSCLLGAKLLAQSHKPFIFSTTNLSLSGRISAHPQSYFTCLPPVLLEMFSLTGGLPKTWWHFSLVECYLQQQNQPNGLIISLCYLQMSPHSKFMG